LSQSEKIGEVYLIGAGPGDPGLITVKGLELVHRADVVVHDPLVVDELLHEVRHDAEVIKLGERSDDDDAQSIDIVRILTERALKGKMVVHLKCGDPFLFGQGGEEVEELIKNGVPVHVVPGVSSSFSVPALAGIPLTHRDHASMVTLISSEDKPQDGNGSIDWSLLSMLGGTIVIIMETPDLEKNMQRLIEGGMDPSAPVTVIEKGSTPEQRMVSADVGNISKRCKSLGIGVPAVVIVGGVASMWKVLGDLS
jgi:uroporphyrin-III C-methyltransferase